MKILHIMIFEKFIRDYIDFLDKNFNINDHSFLVLGKDYNKYNLKGLPNLEIIDNHYGVARLIFKMYKSRKIIIHGLWHKGIIRLLLLQPWLIKKCYWIMWGGDFYNYENETISKKKLIKKLNHFISFIKGDYELVKEWYGANGQFHECIAYPVQLYENSKVNFPKSKKKDVEVLIGNSSDPSNNHLEIFKLLERYKDVDIGISVPLSYGNSDYAKQVEIRGVEIFGDKFKPLKDFIALEEYKILLRNIDIGIFNHRRQQGLGNIIALLSYGKKVYLNKNITTWAKLEEIGVVVFDITELNLDLIDESVKIKNIEMIKKYFNKENYKKQLTDLFYSEISYTAKN